MKEYYARASRRFGEFKVCFVLNVFELEFWLQDGDSSNARLSVVSLSSLILTVPNCLHLS